MQLHGLRFDGRFSDSAQQTWAYAKNILLSRGFDEVENEPGDTLVDSSITGSIIGRIVTPNDIILFTYNGTDIYIRHLSSAGTLKTILISTTTFLNFAASGIYVEGVHCYNAEGDLIIAWTFGMFKPMIMNVTHALATPITITAESQLKDYYLFPEFDHNNFTLSSTAIITGGRLPAAAYFISLTYELEPDVNTNFGVISNPIFITEEDSLTAYKQFRGNASLVVTNKAIVVNVIDIDTARDYFKLIIIQKTESGTQCYITKRIKRSSTNVSVTIDDLDKLTPFNLAEVVTSSPAFNVVKSITQSNKRLRLFNLKKPTKLTLTQIYDELIPSLEVNWVNDTVASLSTTKNSYKDSVFIFDKRGFRSDEVYALYLGLRLKTGGYYGIYHIPGRVATGTEATAETTIDTVAIKNYKLASNASRSAAAISAGQYYGLMGFWQNTNEDYNNNYGTILGTNKVRHHRFPSAGQLNTLKSGNLHTTAKGTLIDTVEFDGILDMAFNKVGNTYYAAMPNNTAPSLGTYVAASLTGVNYNKYTALYNQTITLDIGLRFNVATYGGTFGSAQLLIKKYVLLNTGLYSESTIASPGDTATGTPEALDLAYSGDIVLSTGDYITIEAMSFSENAFEGFTPTIENYGLTSHIHVYEATINQEVLGLRISLDWAHVVAEHSTVANALLESVDGWEIFYAKRTLNNQLMLDQSIVLQEGAGYRFYGFDSMSNLLNIQPTHVKSELYLDSDDYTTGANVNDVTNYTVETAKYSAISTIKYLPAYNSATIPNNTGKENCYYFETVSGTFDKRLVNFINIKDDVYLDFTSQELVSTGVVKPLAAVSAFSLYGGDSFIGHNSVLTFPSGDGVPRIWYFPVESILNSGMRYEGDNDYEKFYPLTDIAIGNGETPPIKEYIVAMIAAGVANLYLYNNDYHLLNTFRQDNINSELTSLINYYPNRIQSSMPQPLESTSVYWRKFKILDYFDMVNNKGAIYKAIGNEYVVYIQTDYSIFRGIIVDKLVTGNIDVALKSSEMFDRPLEELLDTDGTYIKPWDREGMIITPFGLVVADLDKGSIFIISDKANEVTKLGIEDWFRTTVKTTMTFGTKETIGTGVILGYDDIYKRLLVTIKNSNPNTIANFTLSFQLEQMKWICFHRYTPDKYIWNANGMYRIDGISISKMFNGGYGYALTIASAVRSGTGGVTVTVTTTGSHNLKTGDSLLMAGWNVAAANGLFIITVTGLTTLTYTTIASATGAITGGTGIASDPSVIDFMFNSNKGERFLLKNVKWTSNIEASGINYWNETIDRLLIYSKNLCTELISIVKRAYGYNSGTYAMEEIGNTLVRDGEWVFNDIKDYLTTPNSAVLDNNFALVDASLNLSKTWSDKSKFISKFFIVRMIYNNSNTSKKLRISNISVDTKNIL